MIKGTTDTGFKFQIDEDVRDDMELLEIVMKVDAGDNGSIPAMLEMLFGAKQKEKLYEHCRTQKGRVSAVAVMKEIKSIFNEIERGDSKTKN